MLSKATFVVTNDCNGRCVYCFQDENLDNMSVNDADKAIQYLCKNYNYIEKISFFGEEPTLNYEIIKYISNKLKNNINIGGYEITTNAVLICDDMLVFFKTHKFKIIVSLDGPDYIHNKLRINGEHSKVRRI